MRVRIRHRDRRVRIARDREGLVVDGGDRQAERRREGRLLRGQRQLVQDDTLEVALLLRAAGEVGVLALRGAQWEFVSRGAFKAGLYKRERTRSPRPTASTRRTRSSR